MYKTNRSYFKQFKSLIINIGGVFATKDVYYSQMRDIYSAAYLPKYPEYSSGDIIINMVHKSRDFSKANYELVKYDINSQEYHTESFDSIKDIAQRLYRNMDKLEKLLYE